MNLWKIFLVVAFWAIAFTLVFYFPIQNQMTQHETVHAKICEYAGGTANISYGFLRLSGNTHCDNFNENLTKEYYLLNSVNELYGYQFFPFMLIIVAVLVGIILLFFPFVLDSYARVVYKPPQN